jgi:nitric oxide reductase activation protein
VAALLLVDLSRSTANRVSGSDSSVLDVEKEAIVLLSEALQVVGDQYAIDGYSGTGRLGVEYLRIKDFSDPLDDTVRCRIDAMSPRRNTRMGAAIRHAASRLSAVPSRIKLLIILGDGFPNDLNYNKAYAVEDTRRAIAELRAQGIYVHAITVNLDPVNTPHLDELFGDIHHNLITKVTDLPDRLWQIYGALTR